MFYRKEECTRLELVHRASAIWQRAPAKTTTTSPLAIDAACGLHCTHAGAAVCRQRMPLTSRRRCPAQSDDVIHPAAATVTANPAPRRPDHRHPSCGAPGRGHAEVTRGQAEVTEGTSAPWRTGSRGFTVGRTIRLGGLLLLLSLLRIAECCSSRANPRPRSPSPSTRRPYTFQTQPCPEMYQEHYCLNGATCFKVNIGLSPLYNCECTDGFMGQRCQFKDLDGSYSHLRRKGMHLSQLSRGRRVRIPSGNLVLGPGVPRGTSHVTPGPNMSPPPPPLRRIDQTTGVPCLRRNHGNDDTTKSTTNHQVQPTPAAFVLPQPSSTADPAPNSVTSSDPMLTSVPSLTSAPGDPSSPPPCALNSGSRDAILETASIAGGAGVALLICVLLSGMLYVWSKRRRKLNTCSLRAESVRFNLDAAATATASHVVQMPTNQGPPPADVIQLQRTDRWTPPPAANQEPDPVTPPHQADSTSDSTPAPAESPRPLTPAESLALEPPKSANIAPICRPHKPLHTSQQPP